jgi:hypothetical protein
MAWGRAVPGQGGDKEDGDEAGSTSGGRRAVSRSVMGGSTGPAGGGWWRGKESVDGVNAIGRSGRDRRGKGTDDKH